MFGRFVHLPKVVIRPERSVIVEQMQSKNTLYQQLTDSLKLLILFSVHLLVLVFSVLVSKKYQFFENYECIKCFLLSILLCQ